MADAFGFLFGDYVQAHQVCRAGGLARPGYYSQNLSGFELTAAHQ